MKSKAYLGPSRDEFSTLVIITAEKLIDYHEKGDGLSCYYCFMHLNELYWLARGRYQKRLVYKILKRLKK